MDIDNAVPPSVRPGRAPAANAAWRKYVLVALLALVVMAAGAVMGAGAAVLYFGREFLRQPSTPEQAARLITGRLSDSANLSPEELAKTDALVKRRMREVAEIRRKYEEEVARKLGTLGDGISDIIGPERAGMCGEWMHRYRGRDNAGQGQDKKKDKEKDCCCGENGAPCDKR